MLMMMMMMMMMMMIELFRNAAGFPRAKLVWAGFFAKGRHNFAGSSGDSPVQEPAIEGWIALGAHVVLLNGHCWAVGLIGL